MAAVCLLQMMSYPHQKHTSDVWCFNCGQIYYGCLRHRATENYKLGLHLSVLHLRLSRALRRLLLLLLLFNPPPPSPQITDPSLDPKKAPFTTFYKRARTKQGRAISGNVQQVLTSTFITHAVIHTASCTSVPRKKQWSKIWFRAASIKISIFFSPLLYPSIHSTGIMEIPMHPKVM